VAKKLKLYLETSVWNFVFAEDAPEKQQITQKFFTEVEKGRYEIYVSDLVIVEVTDTPIEKKRNQLENLIYEYQPIRLALSEEVEVLTKKYLEAQIVPRKFQEDVIHIAYASAAHLDAIVSWNLRHIVKLKTKIAVNLVNRSLGYKEIEIVTPEEVVGYEN
jgi:predicted nucleic acid-binding protein